LKRRWLGHKLKRRWFGHNSQADKEMGRTNVEEEMVWT